MVVQMVAAMLFFFFFFFLLIACTWSKENLFIDVKDRVRHRAIGNSFFLKIFSVEVK